MFLKLEGHFDIFFFYYEVLSLLSGLSFNFVQANEQSVTAPCFTVCDASISELRRETINAKETISIGYSEILSLTR